MLPGPGSSLRRGLQLAATVLPLILAAVVPSSAKTEPAAPTRGMAVRTLRNGLRVVVRPLRTAPVVSTLLCYRVGSRDELPGSTGIAHFLEHLLFKGTRRLKKGEIDRLTYEAGGTNNAFTSSDSTSYVFNLPRRNWELALRIEADRMRNCTFDKAEFEAERQVVMQERRISVDDSSQNFQEQLWATTFLAHPYRNPIIGWMEDLRRLTRSDVVAFYRRYYRPSNATLVITGDVAPEESFRAVEQAFRHVSGTPAPIRPVIIEPPVTSTRRMQVRLPSGTPEVAIMFHAPRRGSRDAEALELLASVLAGGKLSRLHDHLVEGTGVADGPVALEVGAGASLQRDLGQFGVEGTCLPGTTPERLESALWKEIEAICQAPPSVAELTRARGQYLSGWIHGLETAEDLAAVLGDAEAAGGVAQLEGMWSRIQGVTPDDIQRVARKYLRRDRAVTGELLPREPAKVTSAAGRRAARSWKRRAARSRTTAAPAAETFASLRPIERTLPNGLRLLLLERHNVPSVSLSLRLPTGYYDEPAAQAGVANLCGRTLLEGAGTRTAREISEALETAGAELVVDVGGPTTSVSLRCLSEHVPGLLPVFADVLRRPRFPADRVDLEKRRLTTEMRASEEEAAVQAARAFDRAIYGDHPAGRPSEGTVATVTPLTAVELAAWHAEAFRPRGAVLVAVGDFQSAELISQLQALLADWESAPRSAGPNPPSPKRQAVAATLRIPLDRTQSLVYMGHLGVRRGDPDYVTLLVLDTILGQGAGGGFTARIPYQVRDVQGLAYSVGGGVATGADVVPGTFLITLGTEPSRVSRAIAAVMVELRRIRETLVTPDELRRAVNYLVDSYVFSFQTNDQVVAYLQRTDRFGLGPDYRRRFAGEVRSVTAAAVKRCAQRTIDPGRLTIVIAGPKPGSAGGGN